VRRPAGASGAAGFSRDAIGDWHGREGVLPSAAVPRPRHIGMRWARAARRGFCGGTPGAPRLRERSHGRERMVHRRRRQRTDALSALALKLRRIRAAAFARAAATGELARAGAHAQSAPAPHRRGPSRGRRRRVRWATAILLARCYHERAQANGRQ